jgi:hypothetical protein
LIKINILGHVSVAVVGVIDAGELQRSPRQQSTENDLSCTDLFFSPSHTYNKQWTSNQNMYSKFICIKVKWACQGKAHLGNTNILNIQKWRLMDGMGWNKSRQRDWQSDQTVKMTDTEDKAHIFTVCSLGKTTLPQIITKKEPAMRSITSIES